jgi:DNA helicase TIP49 (TBP-interacting protein)
MDTQNCRIVLTGGPGGGKTTAADLYRREIGDDVVVVPEAATLLFSGGFPRAPGELARQAAQRAIFHVQRGLEDVQSAQYPGRILLCAVARRPQHRPVSVGCPHRGELGLQTSRRHRLQIVHQIAHPHSRRHVHQSMDVVGLARALHQLALPGDAQI